MSASNVFKPKNSPVWHYEFQCHGRRFRGTTGCKTRREAVAVAKAAREVAKEEAKREAARGSGVSLQMQDAALRYWAEKGQHHSGAANTHRDLVRLVEYFGKTKLLSEIDDADVARLVAWRRAQRVVPKGSKREPEDCPLIAPATVNRSTTEVLKKLFTHAKEFWAVRFEHEPKWKRHMLPEPQERVRELHGTEGARLEAAMRCDYEPYFDFIHAAGVRRGEGVFLRWAEVNWDTAQIVTRGKGGRTVTVPITARLREILEPLIGHHEEFVFTYVAQRTTAARTAGNTYAATQNRKGRAKGANYVAQREQEARVKGQRYPLTLSGVNTAWKRLRKRAGVKDFRLHDFRHDFATKLLRHTGNLKLVSRALNHADLKTTARYAHVQDEDVAAALESMHGVPKQTPQSRKGTAA